MEFEIDDPNSIHILHVAFKSLRKINEDIIMTISSDSISFRSVNSSRSALPIINFHPNFFKIFNFNTIRERIIISIPASSIIMSFSKALCPTNLKMSIKDCDIHLLLLTLVDKFGIAHNWEFPSSETSLISAVVNLDETIFQIKCRNDVFNGISDVFKSDNTIILDIKNGEKNSHTLNFKSNLQNGDISLSSTLTLYKCEKCDTIYSDDIKEMQISFFLHDFIVGIKLAGLFAQFLYLYIIGPGQPVVIKSSSTNLFEFEMPLATTSIDKEEEYVDNSKIANSNKNEITIINSSNSSPSCNYNNNTNYSTQSQVVAWHLINDTTNFKSSSSGSLNNDDKKYKTIPSSNNDEKIKNNMLSSSNSCKESSSSDTNSQKEFSNSEKTINDLYEASPPFPFKRKIISQKIVVQASQPLSDEDII
ncbi:hypothetical protein M9Y10_022596 [Tritrichomonas musculus]|uniref:DNA repair protein rad9 n=1 Tax=Tritrichomonas musculus TaxID=1915356 RepID=A0ABR2KSX5_9EUKA